MLICLAMPGHIKPLSPMERNTRLRAHSLTYSLNTFQGTVKAHDAVDVVLLFKIPQGTACDNIKMSVIKDNEKSLIEL